MRHSSNVARPDYTEMLEYSNEQPALQDFSEWLDKLISTSDFSSHCTKYINIYKRLDTETDKEMRHLLVLQASKLKQTE